MHTDHDGLSSAPKSSESPLRIAFVIQTFHPVVGGAERQLLSVLPRLQQRGVEPLVITRRVPGAPRRETVSGINVVRCGHYRWGLLGSAGFFLGTLWHLFRFRPHLCHAFSLMTPASATALYRWLRGSPMVVKILGGNVRGDCHRIKQKPFYRLRRKWLLSAMDATQVISDEIDSELAAMGVREQRRHLIPNGVDVERLAAPRKDSATREMVRQRLGIPANATVVVYIGRLITGKCVDQLIDAFLLSFEQSSPTWLVIAGDGPEREALEKRVGENSRIRFLGTFAEVPQLLAASDIFVLPSVAEGMSNSLLEAMAAGVPVIATRVGAAEKLLGDQERGWLIPPHDQAALENALQSMAENEQREELGQHAQAYVEQHHSMEAVAEQLLKIYLTLTAVGAEPLESGTVANSKPSR